MRTSPPVRIKVYSPKEEAGQQELQRRVSVAHADFVTAYIKKMSCPTQQKLALIDTIIQTAMETH